MHRFLRALASTALAASVVAVVAAGCADAPVDAPAPAAPTAAPTARPVVDDDVAYAQAMLPHVRQGGELVAMVPGRTANPDLARLVLLMDNSGVEDEGQLVGWLRLRGAPVPGEAGVAQARMPGMADAATLDRLRTLSGPAFDRAWIDVMTAHHQGGVDMSRAYLASNPTPALENIAVAQVAADTRQIGQMQALRPRA